MDMLRLIGKQSGESVESVLKKKMKAKVKGLQKMNFLKLGMKERVGDGILIIMSINVRCFAQLPSTPLAQ